MNLFDIKNITQKSPLQYPGGKHFARQKLYQFLPWGASEVVSPFFGGGSFEFYLASKHIKVVGYDLFLPLVNFWQVMSEKPQEVFDIVDTHLQNNDKEFFVALKNGRYHKIENKTEKASMFYLMQALSYNSTGFRGKTIKNYMMKDGSPINPTGKSWGIMFNHHELKSFYNPNITVKRLKFEKSLVKHDNLFAYCDPPYPEVSGMYGDERKYHEDFDHQRLKSVLDSRTGDWILSYNDCETVRDMYPETHYKVYELEWKQGSRKTGKGNELLIKPRR